MKAVIMKLFSWAFLVSVLMSSAWAGESIILYDNFNSNLIDPNKWFGRTSAGGAGLQLMEETRFALLGNLNLLSRAYANPTMSTGESGGGQGLGFKNPDSIKAIKASIRVMGYELKGCGSNDNNSRVRARFGGYFFNTTDNPIPSSSLNDVLANIGLQRNSGTTDPRNILRASAGIALCLDSSCLAFQDLGGVDLGEVSIGQKVTLRLEWDKNNHRFVAQRDNQPEVYIAYSLSDNSLPGLKSKRLEVTQSLTNCTTEPRPTSFMSVFFDDVYVNASALDTRNVSPPH